MISFIPLLLGPSALIGAAVGHQDPELLLPLPTGLSCPPLAHVASIADFLKHFFVCFVCVCLYFLLQILNCSGMSRNTNGSGNTNPLLQKVRKTDFRRVCDWVQPLLQEINSRSPFLYFLLVGKNKSAVRESFPFLFCPPGRAGGQQRRRNAAGGVQRIRAERLINVLIARLHYSAADILSAD